MSIIKKQISYVLCAALLVFGCSGKSKDNTNNSSNNDQKSASDELEKKDKKINASQFSVPDPAAGVNLKDVDVEGFYAFEFRISTWNNKCIEKDGDTEWRIENGEAKNGYGAAYGWYYQIEKAQDGKYLMTRFATSEKKPFDNDYQDPVNVEITEDGRMKVNQTFEYGIHYTNTQETLKMSGTFSSEAEIKGNYLEFAEVRSGDFTHCLNMGEFTIKKIIQ